MVGLFASILAQLNCAFTKQGIHTFEFPKLLLVKTQRLHDWLSFLLRRHFVFRTHSHVSMGLWLFNYNFCHTHTNLMHTVLVIIIQSYE